MEKIKMLIFTDGTILIHSSKIIPKLGGFKDKSKIKDPTYFDLNTYVSIDNAVKKLNTWVSTGVTLSYLSPRKNNKELEEERSILRKNKFPKGRLYHRKGNEEYKEIVERIKPNILIEDDCRSIGKNEIITPKLTPKLKIKCIVVKEFNGIDHLPNRIDELLEYKR